MRALTAEQERVFELLKRVGDHYLDYFHLQDSLEHFHHPRGLISYQTLETGLAASNQAPISLVLGGPVALPEHREEVLQDFLDHHRAEVSPAPPSFMQVRTETGATLAELGYLVNPMGTDATVRLGDFGLHGARMRNLRRRRNQGRSAGLEVREQSFAEVNRDQVLEISRAWREHVKAGRTERRFLSFPFLADDEPGQRKFFGYSAQGELLGFVFFTPVYRAGGVTGYAPNVIRTAPDALPATGDFILLEALLRFQSEGLTWLVLGLCPTREAEVEGPFPGEPTVQRLVRQHMETLDRKFGFLTLSFHKLRYLPEEEPFYWAFPGEDVLRYLIGGLQLTGLF